MIDHKERCRSRAAERAPDVALRQADPKTWTLAKLAERWEVSRPRARQIEAKVLRKQKRPAAIP
jgi:DNA-directed RNA polymerase sigma subunit (sigma70/sigma32)